jgi:hypothetical protein
MTLTEREILEQLPALAPKAVAYDSLADELLAQLPAIARMERARA